MHVGKPSRVRAALASCGLALAAGAVSAAPPAPKSERLPVPTFRGEELFDVASPDAAQAPAKLAGEGAAGKDRLLTSRVVVRTSDAAALDAALKPRGLAVRRADNGDGSLPGFWIVEGPTVRAASSLARELKADPRHDEVYLDIGEPLQLRSTLPSDPGLAQQWHLINAAAPDADINIQPAWKSGITGTGITVGVVEYGFNASHPDLLLNFNAGASQSGSSTDHGTSVAGLVAGDNNGQGGVGVAYNAQVSRQIIGSSVQNADALLFRNDLNQVKTNSWGPFDGTTIAQIPSIERQAIASTATLGRGGLGTVIVWAAGNGGQFGDRVDYDPYASSRYTISIGAVDETDRRSLYSEPGSSLMLVAPSDRDVSSSSDLGVYSSTGIAEFTDDFGGTSASAPIAAGVVALMLQANPLLSWRDVQHILLNTARRCDPASATWTLNGRPGGGKWVSYDYGHGAIDAGAAVAAAAAWSSVAPQVSLTSGLVPVNAPLPDVSPAGVTSTFIVQRDISIESVELVLNVAHTRIGNLRVKFTSPSGTESVVAVPRSDFTQNYNGYVFTSVRHWGERSPGEWRVTVADESPSVTGTFTSYTLNLYGTAPVCPCNFNGVGGVTVQDIYDFLTAWSAGAGDFNNSGATTVQDIYDFLTSWSAPGQGC